MNTFDKTISEKPKTFRKKRLLDWRLMDKKQFNVFLYGHILGFLALFFVPEHWLSFILIGHFITIGLGGSVGYHRLLAHRSFNAPNFVKRLLATCGALALQGGPLSWSSAHRTHHAKTDQYGDPHSSAKGRWWSHIAWAIYKGPNGFRYKDFDKSVHDLSSDPYMVFLEKYALHISIVLFVLVGAFWGLAEALWLFPLRVVIGWHTTFFVNSFAHDPKLAKAGETSSLNVFWVSCLTYGDGWHRNHHTKPGNPNFSRKWWQIDLGFWMIKIMTMLGLASFRVKRS